MRKIKWIVLCMLVLALTMQWSVSAQDGDGNVDYKKYSPWLNFEIGTSIKTKMEMTGYSSETVSTLVSISDENYTLKTEMFGADGAVQHTAENTLPIKPEFFSGKKSGSETLNIDGTDYNCDIWEYEKTVGQAVMKFKVWINDKLHTSLKSTVVMEGPMASTTESITKKIGEKVKIGDTEFDCILTVSTTKGTSNTTTSMWFSNDVPGGMVKMESVSKYGETETKSTTTLIEINKK